MGARAVFKEKEDRKSVLLDFEFYLKECSGKPEGSGCISRKVRLVCASAF